MDLVTRLKEILGIAGLLFLLLFARRAESAGVEVRLPDPGRGVAVESTSPAE
jgi:hypothetical protein